jgi:general nucleoside transport system permease protein
MEKASTVFKVVLFNAFLALAGLFLGCLVTIVAGENPLKIASILVVGAFGSWYDFGLTLYFAALFMLTGFSVGIPLKSGLFNIGSEGQLNVAALSVASGLVMAQRTLGSDLHPLLVTGLAILFGSASGMVWSGISGWIRAYRGGHEVISTIMLNFIASGVTSWLVTAYLQASDSQSPETTPIPDGWKWARGIADAPLSWNLLLAPLMGFALWWMIKKTKFGFEVQATAENPKAADFAGVSVTKIRFLTFVLGGAMAGLCGVFMVMQDAGRYRLEMGSGFGYMGIPVALLGEGHPLGIVLSALLFAALYQGSSALDIESAHVGRDLAQVIQAIVVVVVVSKVFLRGRRIFGIKVPTWM